MKRILLLGATGSIGRSTLDVVRSLPDRFQVVGMVAGSNADGLAALAREFSPDMVAVADINQSRTLANRLSNSTCKAFGGEEGVLACVQQSNADLCVSAIVGSAGLKPTLAAIEKGMDIALANKETLVAGGELVTDAVRQQGVRLIPVDSEHHALQQCLAGTDPGNVRRLVITASGGPFRGRTTEQLQSVTAREALDHPTWNMGAKVSIDSATLANKALEVIEAHWLFGIPYDNISVIVHPQSIVHGMVEFEDGTMLAQMAVTDMRVPIQYALTEPERIDSQLERLDLMRNGTLGFEEPDRNVFPMLDIGIRAGQAGGVRPAVFSAANETAVQLFLDGRIGFCDIPLLVEEALSESVQISSPGLNDILQAEQNARDTVNRRKRT